ncbi:MAG: hypothetical protein JST22_02645 [Bacteroidetes bacterium]|nr:hypothetical protein [Bacteroidota bacterium]
MNITPHTSSTIGMEVPAMARHSRRPAGNLRRAGHAHAGALLLIALRYVDEATLPVRLRSIVRPAVPGAAILMPAGFFLSALIPDPTAPNSLINRGYVGAAVLAVGVVLPGTGLARKPARRIFQPHHGGMRIVDAALQGGVPAALQFSGNREQNGIHC